MEKVEKKECTSKCSKECAKKCAEKCNSKCASKCTNKCKKECKDKCKEKPSKVVKKNGTTRAVTRQKEKIAHLTQIRDMVSKWQACLFKSIKKPGDMAPLEVHLLHIEHATLEQLAMVLNALVRFNEVRFRNDSGDIVGSIPALEKSFIRSWKAMARNNTELV